MDLHQLQIANDSVQDRLVLRIGTEANEEFRIYFTRHFLREIWPHLTAMLSGHLGAAAPAALPESEPEAEAAGFAEPFREDHPRYPLGSTPLLASEATLEAGAPGEARFTLREGRERSFTLDLDAELLQILCAMLHAASEQAQWDLLLDYDAPAAIAGPGGPSSLLH
ncbi:hypothetical protein [Dechloromonas denitrificans]|uniref:hypothetical protein n=1 Tax=Dechloromonas denitrificans TaxID=281362 RepID=UPI001CF8DEFB|nr:hypothetical protein [Dechloromonas denitrificans]UCV04893.1 hypothetical protein KI611_06440 [Dechloromonas denitrificans]